MATKIFSAKPGGRTIRTINKPSIDERIIQLNRELGYTVREARMKLQWINVSIEAKQYFNNA